MKTEDINLIKKNISILEDIFSERMNLIRYYQTSCYLLQERYNDMIINKLITYEVVYNKYSHMKHVEVETNEVETNEVETNESEMNESETRTYLNHQLHSFDDLPGLSWTSDGCRRKVWFKRGIIHRRDNHAGIFELDNFNQKIYYDVEDGKLRSIQVIGQKIPRELKKRKDAKIVGTFCYFPDIPIRLNEGYEYIF